MVICQTIAFSNHVIPVGDAVRVVAGSSLPPLNDVLRGQLFVPGVFVSGLAIYATAVFTIIAGRRIPSPACMVTFRVP